MNSIAALVLVRGADFLCCSSTCIFTDLLLTKCSLVFGFYRSRCWFTGSRFLPGFLGAWLTIDGLAWAILSLTGVLSPQYYDKLFTYSQPASFGEVAFMLWLVIKGASPQPLPSAVSSSAAG